MENEPKNRTKWFSIIEEYQTSDLTQAEFCKQKNVTLAKFAYYLQVYRKQNNINATRQEAQPSFSQVVVNQAVISAQNEIKIKLPNGFRCQIAYNISPEILKKIVGALLSC
ncbi:MAG: hypothetical protein H0U71_01630 [Gammaproteobacteria bacterium]|nr:hypothetical protein [Gammaproteobacteria bacterium]